MTALPILSIIVPVYNAEMYLQDCLDSILAQTFTDFELILVNDGSTDKSGNICDSYRKEDSRIRVIHKKNGGASTSRKAGVKAATGSYIGWVDADDTISSDMFKVLYDLAEEYNADIAECQYIKIQGNNRIQSGKEEQVVSGSGDFILKQFFSAKMKPSFCNKLYKSQLFNDLSFPSRQIHVDLYVNMKFSLMPLNYARTPKAMYYYFVRENSNYTTYNSSALREAIYKYEYTIELARTVESDLAKEYLNKDAVNRLLGRYFQITVNSKIKNQIIYNRYLKKKLGFSLVTYLIKAKLPFKKRVGLILLICNMKESQAFLHKHFGKKSNMKSVSLL